MKKTCWICKQEKEIECFGKNKQNKDGKEGRCSECRSNIRHKKKLAMSPEEKDILNKNIRDYYRNNKEHLDNMRKDRINKRSPEQKEEIRTRNNEYNRGWYERNKQKHHDTGRIRKKERKKEDPVFKMALNIRDRVLKAFKRGGFAKKTNTKQIIGCSFEELQLHLISTAVNNYGYYSKEEVYHIDHIIPLCLAKTEEEILKLAHWSNLQYLTPKDNRKKWKHLDFVIPKN